MVQMHQWLTLPSSLLVLLLARCINGGGPELEWPYNLPPHMKYYPQDEAIIRRNVEVQQRLQEQTPTGIRKMSGDPGEKFMMDYWHFDEDQSHEICAYGNATTLSNLSAPLKRHGRSGKARPILPRFLGSQILDKRAFECPADSYACTSIGRPDSCCGEGSTCQIVPDNGLGDVGCCAGNQVCGGTVSTCPDQYTSCPQNPGGGCCLPGYACQGVGCVQVSTTVVVIVPTPSTSSTTPLPSTSTTNPPPSPTSGTTTVVVVTTPTTNDTSTTQSPSSSSQAPNTLVCSSGFRSCPVSLGGGCCPTDRACGRDVCPELSSTNSFSAPARPTGTSDVTSTTSSSTSTSVSVPPPGCPTGFYACSAFYGGGCCQTGRNCDVTSCPASGSITVVDGSSISVIAPTGTGVSSAQTLLTGSCASGWSTCAQSVGGGCCPTGYACGMQCTATATNGYNATIGKIAPNEAIGLSQNKDSLFALVVTAFVLFACIV